MGAHGNVVLKAWLCEQPDVRLEIVLQTETHADRTLPRDADDGLFGSLQHAVQIVTCFERCMNGDFRRQPKTAIKAPDLSVVYVVDALHRDADIVDCLLLVDGITV